MMPSVAVGKILIQRDEATAMPQLMYSKLPPDIARRPVLLLDPMLATGGSAVMACKVLVDQGVPPENIIFVNIVCVQEGLDALAKAYPAVQVVTGAIDPILNDKKYIVPGLGDFGDRYFGCARSGSILSLALLLRKNSWPPFSPACDRTFSLLVPGTDGCD